MRKISIISISLLAFLTLPGCGQRIAGNPSNFSYDEYSDYEGYKEKRQKEIDQKIKEQNPQSVIPNPTRPGESKKDFNKAYRYRFRDPS